MMKALAELGRGRHWKESFHNSKVLSLAVSSAVRVASLLELKHKSPSSKLSCSIISSERLILALCHVLPTFFILIHVNYLHCTQYTPFLDSQCTAVTVSGKITRFDTDLQRMPWLVDFHHRMPLEAATLHCRTISH